MQICIKSLNSSFIIVIRAYADVDFRLDISFRTLVDTREPKINKLDKPALHKIALSTVVVLINKIVYFF